MAKSKEEWIQEAHAKSEGGVYTGQVVIARVRNLDEAQRQYRGEHQHLPLDVALNGEKSGHWQVVGVFGVDAEGNLTKGD